MSPERCKFQSPTGRGALCWLHRGRRPRYCTRRLPLRRRRSFRGKECVSAFRRPEKLERTRARRKNHLRPQPPMQRPRCNAIKPQHWKPHSNHERSDVTDAHFNFPCLFSVRTWPDLIMPRGILKSRGSSAEPAATGRGFFCWVCVHCLGVGGVISHWRFRKLQNGGTAGRVTQSLSWDQSLKWARDDRSALTTQQT